MLKIIKINLAIIALIGLFYTLTGYSSTAFRQHIVYQINGLQPSLTNSVHARLAQSICLLTEPLTEKVVSAWFQHSGTEVKKALAPYGYFKPSILSKLVYQNEIWYAYYQISPGPALKITHLKIAIQGEGSQNTTLKKQLAEFPLQEGKSFQSEVYEKIKQKLLVTAIAEGYLSAYFYQHQVLIDQTNYTANVTLILDTGPRYYFGPLVFQQAILKDSFLKRYVPFSVGSPYSSDQLLKLQNNLNASGYFRRTSIKNLAIKPGNQIPVVFQLVPRPSQQYMAGIGYSTDLGIKGTLGWESRYLNQWGHKLSFLSQLSKIQKSFQANYIIPGMHPDSDSYNVNFAIVRKQLAQVDSTTEQIGVSSLSNWSGWQRNLFLNYQIEHFNYTDSPNIRSHLLTPGISVARSQFDNPIYALHGYNINLRLQGGDKNLLSSTSFLQTQLQMKYITSWNESSRLLLRSDLGATLTSNLSNFPPSLLFYAGGSQSIRGYGYQTLGPGRYLAVGSLEYQHRLIDNFYGSIFFDAGNAVNSFPLNLQKAAGIGVVWASPLGPMELTLAKAFNLPGQPARIQFSMGIELL
jgi:translocation and assembly module TamA